MDGQEVFSPAFCNTPEELCDFLNISHKQLMFFSHAETRKLYRVFVIPKKSGGIRAIYSPIKTLKLLQTRIRDLLYPFYKKPDCVLGLEPNTSIVKNAEKHLAKDFVVNLDIKNFFESIHIGRIIGLFEKVLNVNHSIAVLLSQLVTVDGKLVTGSPCSPLLADMVFFKTDYKIKNYIKNKDISYTRYADDITFSFKNIGNIKVFFEGYHSKALNRNLIELFSKAGFEINDSKIRIQNKNMHQQVTGIKVNKDKNLSNYFLYGIKWQLHLATKYGVESVSQQMFPEMDKDKAIKKWKNVICGKISYTGMVKGKTNKSYITFAITFNNLFGNRYFKVFTDKKDIISKKSVVFMSCFGDDVSATGFYYRGHIITCNHCLEIAVIDENRDAILYDNPIDKHLVSAKLIAQNDKKDLALFKPTGNSFVELISGQDIALAQGLEITLFGYPSYKNDCPNDTVAIDGKITCKRKNEDGNTVWCVDQPIELGFSGGPVIDKTTGRLIGIIVDGSKDQQSSYFQNGFLPIKDIDELIDEIELSKK